jgi:hypothetical protein
LILPTFRKYFHTVHHAQAGGPIAYPLLTHNANMWALDPERKKALVAALIEQDRRYCSDSAESFFDYFVGTPNREVAEANEADGSAEAEESKRESAAGRRGGIYYFPHVAVDEKLEFCSGGRGRAVLHEGFSGIEPVGTWAQRDVVVIRFSLSESGHYSLLLGVTPLALPDKIVPQRVYAFVNGALVKRTTIETRSILIIDLPGATAEFEVTLVLPDLRSPADLIPGYQDERSLSLLLSQMEVHRRTASSPA